MKKKFLLTDVLCIATGKLLAPECYAGVWDILSFMVGANLSVEQLVSARDSCREFLLDQHPQLKAVNMAGVGTADFKEWLQAQKKLFGDGLEIEPLPKIVEKNVEQFRVKIGGIPPK
jgi:hypothetical protein